MNNIFLTLIITFSSALTWAQQNVFITFSPKVANADLVMGTNVSNLDGVDFNLEYFDYYISGVHIIHDGGQDLDLSENIYLIEPNNNVMYLGFWNITNIEQINFAVGVPPNLNTQNGADAIDISVYPHGHPLSFQEPSMYWGWTSGYAHVIIGGLADSDGDNNPDALFQIHNLDNSNYLPFELPVVQTQSNPSQIDVYVNCNVDVWIKNIAIETIGVQHGSNAENVLMMQNILTDPVFNQSASASLSNASKEIGTLTFLSENSTLSITWKNIKGVDSYELTDVSGKKVRTGAILDETGKVDFNNLSNGIYQFKIFDKNSNSLNTIKVAI